MTQRRKVLWQDMDLYGTSQSQINVLCNGKHSMIEFSQQKEALNALTTFFQPEEKGSERTKSFSSNKLCSNSDNSSPEPRMGVVYLLNALHGEVREKLEWRPKKKTNLNSSSSSLLESSIDKGSLKQSHIGTVQLLNALKGQVGGGSRRYCRKRQRHITTC